MHVRSDQCIFEIIEFIYLQIQYSKHRITKSLETIAEDTNEVPYKGWSTSLSNGSESIFRCL